MTARLRMSEAEALDVLIEWSDLPVKEVLADQRLAWERAIRKSHRQADKAGSAFLTVKAAGRVLRVDRRD